MIRRALNYYRLGKAIFESPKTGDRDAEMFLYSRLTGTPLALVVQGRKNADAYVEAVARVTECASD